METAQETKPEVERKVSGYVYAPNTTRNFQRMKSRGIPLPPFRVEDNVTKVVFGIFSNAIAVLQKMIIKVASQIGAQSNDAAYGIASDNAMTELLDYLNERLTLAFSINEEGLHDRLRDQLRDAQNFYFKEFFEDAPENLTTRISFDLEHDKVFQQNIDGLRKHYLNNSIERIEEGLQGLKKDFLTKFIGWIEGENDLEGMQKIMDDLKKSSERGARMFARDQFSKFNKSLAKTSYEQAGATHVQGIPVGDGRTRASHTVKAMTHRYGSMIFPIDKIPEEYHDYNCRCGLIPVFID